MGTRRVSPGLTGHGRFLGAYGVNDPVSPDNVNTYSAGQSITSVIKEGENRKAGNVWNYADVDNLNTDQMFAGKYTYSILSSEPASIIPHLFEDFDPAFRTNVKPGDIVIAGDNFGCGSSREHPSVGLAYAGTEAVIVKSVNRIFYRSSINQGLVLIVHKEAVEAYKQGDNVSISLEKVKLRSGSESLVLNR
jgi:3-isopropylmalate dehydratase small subunit